ncbi:MFS transporter [Brenneria corticis]|nr:MFS transporter [Brenneria sp. CFCC 11842]
MSISSMSTSIGNRRWGIIAYLFLNYIAMFIARTGMSMCGPIFLEEYNWTATEFGWISTAFFIGYAITMMPAGILSDRYGGSIVLVIGTLWWAVFTFLTPLVGSTVGLMILIRILVGIGQGVVVPSDCAIVASWVPQKEAGLASGFRQAGCPLGIALSMGLAAYIIETWNWQAVFYSFSMLGILWCLIWWYPMKGTSHPSIDSKISHAELMYIEAGQVKPVQQTVVAEPTGGELTKKDIFSTPSIWAYSLSYFCALYLFFMFMSWLPTYFALGRGINLKMSAIYSMLPYLVAIAAYPIGGLVADYLSNRCGPGIGRKFPVICGMLLAGLFLVIAIRVTSLPGAVCLISTSNFFLCFTMGAYFSIPMEFSVKFTGTIVGLCSLFGSIGGIFAPVLTGWIIDLSSGQYEYGLYLGAGIAILGALFAAIIRIRPIEKKSVA